LAEKIENTYKASVADPSHSPFLKSFGEFHVASLAQTEAPADKVMLEMLLDMQRDMQGLKRRMMPPPLLSSEESGIDSGRKRVLLEAAVELLKKEGTEHTVVLPNDQFCEALIRKLNNATGLPVFRVEADAALIEAARILGKFRTTAPKSERP
jgi:hypothetical protein